MGINIGTIELSGTVYRDVEVEVTRYSHDGSVALQLTCIDDMFREPLATASVLLEHHPLTEGFVWVKDYSENEGLEAQLVAAGVIELTGRSAGTGRVRVNEARVTDRFMATIQS